MTTASYSGETPAERTQRWHTEARERDEAYLALGPADDTETDDSPWRGGPTDDYDYDEDADGAE